MVAVTRPILRFCSHPHCRVLVTAGRCAVHEQIHQQRRGSSGWARQRANDPILTANPWCAVCRCVRSQVVDHIRPLADGGADTSDNKQALCIPCHRLKTEREQRGRGRGGVKSFETASETKARKDKVVCGCLQTL